MATVNDLAGTISNQFAIGKENIKIMTGNGVPSIQIGNIGDLFVTNYNNIDSDDVFASYALMVANPNPEDGAVYEVTSDETKSNKTTYYDCKVVESTTSYTFNSIKEARGRVYIKDAKEGTNGDWKEVGTGTGGATTIKYW